MIQGQFLSRVEQVWIQSFPSPRLVASPRLKNQAALLFTHSWKENNWIHTFPKGISAMWKTISLILVSPCPFPTTITITPLATQFKYQNSSIWTMNRILLGAITLGQSGLRERWQWRGTLHYPKLQRYWSLTIKLFNVISRILIKWRDLTLLQRCSWYILQPPPADWAEMV